MATPFLLLLLLLCPLTTTAAPSQTSSSSSSSSVNPFTVKAAVLRYWDRKIPVKQLPRPSFLLSKLSPLSALDSATYSSLAAANPSFLTARLPAFCSAARLLCSSSFTNPLASHHGDSRFANYDNINFTNYGSFATAGADSFKNYSFEQTIPVDSFKSYSRDAVGHEETFKLYSLNGTIVTDNFTSYAAGSTGGSGAFSTYGKFSQVPELNFANYEADSNGHAQNFTSYSDETSTGDQTFTSYGKNANGLPTTFKSYATDTRLFISTFKGYSENANGPADTFIKYDDDQGISHVNFKSYADDANGAVETFSSYRGNADVGDDKFQSYGKGGNHPTLKFTSYGQDFNSGEDHFKLYGEAFNNAEVTFTTYKGNPSDFASYSNTSITFKDYQNISTAAGAAAADTASGKTVKRWVEPGKFFRESSLKEGIVMPMPDIRDKMPERSFLPRSISRKLPFNATELTRIFNLPTGTALGRAIGDTIAECRRAPSRGETKRCPTSAEDMIDFAVSVLGSSAVPRSTESASGSGGDILIGKVKGINGGKVTESVSCHQSLFPYLVYYCHSVPMVRVYEAEILAVRTKEKINRGVAICHLDTSAWGPEHGAFAMLGSKPGQIEVCHWIFQGDMTWVTED